MNTTLVFDYDGTIHNTMTIYEPAIRETCSWLLANDYIGKATMESLTNERISGWLGMNARDMWLDLAPCLSAEIQQMAIERTGAGMESLVRQHRAKWYEGAAPVLDRLKTCGYSMVILSNSRKKDGIIHFEEFHMDKWFDKWYDCESFDWAPKTDIIETVAGDYPGRLIVIGDRSSDIEAAVAIGATAIGCKYGYGSLQELEKADYQLADIKELPEILGRS